MIKCLKTGHCILTIFLRQMSQFENVKHEEICINTATIHKEVIMSETSIKLCGKIA